jgi:hypothetical protein
MTKVKLSLALGLILNYYQSVSQKNFVILETNVDKSKVQQCLATARKCEAVMQKNSPHSSLNFSSNSTISNNTINNFQERFMAAYPQTKPSSSNDPLIERMLLNEKPNVMRLTYCFLPKDQNSTADFIQLILQFDPKENMKILDMFIRGKSEVGAITLTEREKLKFKKPEPPAPVAKTAPKESTPKPAAKKTSTTTKKSTAKTPAKTTKPAAKPTTPTTPKKK